MEIIFKYNLKFPNVLFNIRRISIQTHIVGWSNSSSNSSQSRNVCFYVWFKKFPEQSTSQFNTPSSRNFSIWTLSLPWFIVIETLIPSSLIHIRNIHIEPTPPLNAVYLIFCSASSKRVGRDNIRHVKNIRTNENIMENFCEIQIVCN